MSESQVKGYMARYRLRNGRDTRFKHGEVTYKPPKGIRLSPTTEFKPGHRPANWKPVGSERLSKDGYIEVKVCEPKTWRAKHVVIWERLHGSKPKGHAVIFADGNKRNLEPGNLIMVSRHTLLVLNRLGLLSSDPDVTRSGVITAELIAEIERRQKGAQKYVQTRVGVIKKQRRK